MRRDNPIHREWLEAQADMLAASLRRDLVAAQLRALNNPSPEARAAAQRVRETLATKRRERKEAP